MNKSKKLLYVTSSLPALTLTFIYREIFGLRKQGFEIETVSMNRPDRDSVSEEAQGLLGTTLYLDQVSLPSKIVSAIGTLFRRPRALIRCLGIWFGARPMKNGARDYARLGYHLIEACHLYGIYRDRGIDHLHAHFVNGPSSIAMFLSILLDRPFSFTMHASLIWLDPVALYNKLDTCKFCASISEYNRDYVVSEYGAEFASRIEIVRCGIDMDKLVSIEHGSSPDAPFTIVGVGQLTKRKGFHVLIEACGLLSERGREFRCLIVGEGTQRPDLESLIAKYRLDGIVSLEGAQPQERIPSYLGQADLFALPCVIADDGWRDGIPVALMEAMAHEIPVVSTNILGLPELIDDGENGVLVESGDAGALADSIESLMDSAKLRNDMGVNANAKVGSDFNVEVSVKKLATLF